MRRWIFFLTLLSLPLTAHAELVIFTDGGFLKVADFQIEGERLRLGLKSGGQIVVSMLRVDRILEDEITEPEPEPEAPPLPAFQLSFDPSQPRPQTPYADLIYNTAERHALNPALLAAVARAESGMWLYRSPRTPVRGSSRRVVVIPNWK